jgi:hypothetical protein
LDQVHSSRAQVQVPASSIPDIHSAWPCYDQGGMCGLQWLRLSGSCLPQQVGRMGWEGRSQRRVLASCGSRELRTNGKPPAPPARLVEKGPGFRRGVLWVRCHQKNRKSGKPHHWPPLAQCSSAIHRPSSATPDARLAVEAQCQCQCQCHLQRRAEHAYSTYSTYRR